MFASQAALAIFMKHILGGINSAIVNVVYDSPADWLVPVSEEKFKKPIWQSELNFLSQFLVVLPLFMMQYNRLRREKREGIVSKVAEYDWRSVSLLILPSVLDLIAQSLSMTGNMWIMASLIVVMKGLRLLFATLIAKFVLKTKYELFHWFGVSLVFCGVVVYSLGSSLGKTWINRNSPERLTGSKKTEESWKMFLGMALVIMAELLRAFRSVYEEKLIKGNRMCPKFVAVVEGGLCTILGAMNLFIVHCIPGSQGPDVGVELSTGGSFENFFNTIEWLKNSNRAFYLTMYLFFTNGFITYFGFVVTQHLSAVQNSLWSELRIPIVWLTEMIIETCIMNKPFFSPWTVLHFIGFALIIIGGSVFNKKIIAPWPVCYKKNAIQSKLDTCSSALKLPDEWHEQSDLSSLPSTKPVTTHEIS